MLTIYKIRMQPNIGFLKKTHARMDLCFRQNVASLILERYCLSYNFWGRCISMILTQTEGLTREAIWVASRGRLVIFCSNLLSGYRAQEGSTAYARSLVWLLCWRSLSSVLEKLLLGFACWENFIFVYQKLLSRYLDEKDQVSWTRNFSHIMLRKFEEPFIINFFW